MDVSAAQSVDASEGAIIQLRLSGPLRASVGDIDDILPPLRKARALFVILALTDEQSVSRRQLAGLLWSRYAIGQALARLRDALSTLRKAFQGSLVEREIVIVSGERVYLRPGAVSIQLGSGSPLGNEIAADLNGIDPALDDWLRAIRPRLRLHSGGSEPTAPRTRSTTSRRGTVVGVCALAAIGLQGDDYLALTLAEEIATALARMRGVVVIPITSVTNAQSSGRDLRSELGVDFLLEGSLQRLGERLRVSVKLVDAETGAMCWSSHFDYAGQDSLTIQQDVASLVAAGLEPELPMIAAERLRRTGDDGEDAFPLILRAITRIHLLDRLPFMEAGELLTRAIHLEPEYSPAHSWFALWLAFLVGQGWARDPRATIARAGEAAEHAVMLDPNDARGLTIAGHVRAYLHRRLDDALPLHERALAINPSLPLAWHFSGVAYAYKGELGEARQRLEQCRRLAPRDPHSFFVEGATLIVEFLSHNHREAALIGRRVTQLHPRFLAAYKPYLAALGHLGETREAAAVHRRLLALEPEFTIRSFRASSPFVNREHNDHYAAGLALAGVP